MATQRAPKLIPLPDDPRYAEFVRRYAMDLPRFCIEVCGLTPTWQQLEFLESIQRPGSRTSVSSGHGTGKTQIFAVACWWHLTVYKFSNTILSGPKLEIVLSGVRKYAADIQSLVEAGPHAWIAPHVVITHKTMYVRGFKSQWWVMAKTAPAGKPEAMAGEHRRFLTWLIDECSGVDDKVMGVILGSLTEEWNRIALASQPTRASGLFYDSHHRMSEGRGGPWRNIVMNSEESPLVSDGFIEEKLLQYGGREDPQYQIKVLGMFPEKLEGQLLSRQQLEATIGRACVIKPGMEWGWVVSVDVAAGEYRDKSVVKVCRVSGYGQFHESTARRVHVVSVPIASNSIQPTALVAEIVQIAGRLNNATVVVDVGGLGLSIYKRLDELGVPLLVKVLWGKPCWSKRLQDQYFNQRAQAMVSCAKAIVHDQVSIAPDAFRDSRLVDEFLDQCRVPYHYNDRAQYVIESKHSKEWEGLPSPDMLDTLSFTFLESVVYTATEQAATEEDLEDSRVRAVKRMKSERAALLAQLQGEGEEKAEESA